MAIEDFKTAKQQLDALYHDEDQYWRQRAKKKMDQNTHFFDQCASAKRRRNWIHSIRSGENCFTSMPSIHACFRSFYVDLLGTQTDPLLHLNWNRMNVFGQASTHNLDAPFNSEEILSALEGMGSFKSPGSNSLPIAFCISF
ncbi:hypothetical protein Cni_G06849 [Canna indica]|uniref:Uncharacterized protein n=1 Tax=Canna indica TaxID=4628 RepID=A0AAQ3Q6Y7_9LILI|nr:hypothetical protein Cni_G06849 [Canna indica]